ncbi:MAG: hypothetical protein PQ612_02545 [Rickettsiales bacterium]|nr:hypothetical protein [Pseudomonadota bacterium]MDA0966008.1 hypothetical protein [Pseudomonadota bacterium]MDG4542521.1 hypothetical protein [Rickettsiales bacterium]MDG4545025.1 hypothetical protein [Rickettsiales bacterium]MDG4547148.1 hypothetical protein [Rickettsiales bacterium]
MNRVILLLLLLLLFSFVNTSYADEKLYEDALTVIEENAGTGEHGLPKDIIALLKAKEKLAMSGQSKPHEVVPIIVQKLNPQWAYSKRGSAYRIALLETLAAIGNKASEDIIPALQEIINDSNEHNEYVKMQAKYAIMAIKDKGNYTYGASSYIPDPKFLNKQESADILFSDLSVVKYKEMKEHYGLEGVVKIARDLPKDSQAKLAGIMVKDDDIFASYQGALLLLHSGLEDEAEKALTDIVIKIYKSGDEMSGRIIYSMVHVLDNKLLDTVFAGVQKQMLEEVDKYSDDMIENLYDMYNLKKGENLKVDIEAKRAAVKDAIRNSHNGYN